MKNKNAPDIRFIGYTNDWYKTSFINLVSLHARIGWQNLRKTEFLKKGDILLITGTDFQDGYINFSTCHYVAKERYIQDSNIQVKNGNILITKDGTLGKIALVKNLPMKATLNAGVFNVIINNKNINNIFLYQYLKAPFLMNYINSKSTGGTIKHLNQNILVDFPVSQTKKVEQDKIGAFFNLLDNMILSSNKNVILLKNIKNKLFIKMFNYANEIEIFYKKIKDISSVHTGDFINITCANSKDKYPIYNGGKNSSGYTNSYNCLGNKILISSRGTSGFINFVHSKCWIGSCCYKIDNIDKDIDELFLYYYLKANQNYFYDSIQKSSVPALNKNSVDEFIVKYPCKNKQIQIRNIFMKLDSLISSNELKLTKLELIKKSLLNKMFI